MLAIFVTVFAARLLLVSLFASPLPFSDEWDAGAAGLYAPYLSGDLSIAHLLAPHNEHRFLTSRLLSLAEFEVAGGWNVRFQMAINAALAAGIATWMYCLASRLVRRSRRLILALATAFAFALPIDSEASLMGMNAHFYLMIIFSLGALLALVRSPVLGPRWWLGIVLSALAYLSMASAALTPLVAIVVMTLQMISGVRRGNLREFAATGLLVAVAMTMLYFVPTIPQSEPYKAHSLAQFFGALVAIGALPLMTPLGIAVVHGPIFAHVWRTVRERRSISDASWIAVAIAGWIAAQVISIAYNRALISVSSRYLDIVLLALPIGTAILLSAQHSVRLRTISVATWLFVVVTSMSVQTAFTSVGQIRDRLAALDREQPVVTAFLTTKDPTEILARKATVSYPDPARLVAVLNNPVIQSLIPDEIQPVGSPVVLDRSRLVLRGYFKHKVDKLVSLLLPIATVLLAAAAGLWFVAGYLRSSD